MLIHAAKLSKGLFKVSRFRDSKTLRFKSDGALPHFGIGYSALVRQAPVEAWFNPDATPLNKRAQLYALSPNPDIQHPETLHENSSKENFFLKSKTPTAISDTQSAHHLEE